MTTQVPGPPVVYLPLRLDADGGVAGVAMLRLADGQIALLGYSALDRLVDCCGEEQPWMLAEKAHLEAISEVQPYDVKLLDVSIPPAQRARLMGAADG